MTFTTPCVRPCKGFPLPQSAAPLMPADCANADGPRASIAMTSTTTATATVAVKQTLATVDIRTAANVCRTYVPPPPVYGFLKHA